MDGVSKEVEQGGESPPTTPKTPITLQGDQFQPVTRAQRLVFKHLDKCAARIRNQNPEGVNTVVCGLAERSSAKDAIRIAGWLRDMQRVDDAEGRPRRPLVLLLDFVGRTGAMTQQQTGIVSVLTLGLMEWLYEFHFPEPWFSLVKHQRALRNYGWKREGLIPEILWSFGEDDFFAGDTQLHVYDEAGWENLVKKCPRVRRIEHVEEALKRRHQKGRG